MPPETADADAEPDWEQVSTEPHYVWHDHRTHWMTREPAAAGRAGRPDPCAHRRRVDRAAARRRRRRRGRRRAHLGAAAVAGAGLAGLRALVLAAAAAGLLARTPRPLGVLMLVGGAAALWHAVATPEPPASLGSHAGAIVAALLPAGTAVLAAALGFRAAWRGRGAMAGLLAIVLGWLFLVQGLPDVDVLWSANVAVERPAGGGPGGVAVLVAFGVGLVVGGIAAVRRFRESGAPQADVDARSPVPVG